MKHINMEEVKGLVFDIKKFSTQDGPGVRTTVFLKGCPLSCLWCHNPESQDVRPEISYYPLKCTGCNRCASVCTNKCHCADTLSNHIYNRNNCTRCFTCVQSCYSRSLTVVGKMVTAGEVMDEVLKDSIYYKKSGGGLTLSGGEPMYQFEMTRALLSLAKKHGIHTCMETCGHANSENLAAIAALVDLFLYDYKESDPGLHKQYTGHSNTLILKNLIELDKCGAKIILRCPFIPGYNDRDDHFSAIAEIAESLENIQAVEIEPYHPMGKSKCEAIGRTYMLDAIAYPDRALAQEWADRIQRLTHIPVSVS